MRKQVFLMVLFCFYGISVHAQCLSGNCDNGEGIWKDATGATYKGEFKNGTISGQGILTYPTTIIENVDLESIQDEITAKLKEWEEITDEN